MYNGNTFRMYLKEISAYPLLNVQQEQEYGCLIQAGLQAKEKLDNGVDSPIEAAELQDVVAQGEAARDALVNHNLRLVVKVAKKYSNEHLSLQDLVSEGNLGLIKAAEKYDPSLGYRFSTSAVIWIKQAITKSICDKGRNIRIPAHIYQALSKYRKTRDELTTSLQATPTPAQIAEKMGITTERLAELLEWNNGDTISLQTSLGDESDDTLEDLQADQSTLTPLEYSLKEEQGELIQKAFATLPPRSAIVMKLRFGLGDKNDPADYHREHTLDEIGKILGISRERVRQIENQSKNALKTYLSGKIDLSNI